jgi:CBS domain-containing protein
MRAKDIMTKEVIAVDKNTSVKEAAIRMADTGVGSVIVNEHDHLKGIITDRDIAIRAVANFDDLNDIPCQDIMTKGVITADEDSNMEEVIDLMSNNQVKRIPILKRDAVIGMISLGDISQSYEWDDEASEVLSDITKYSHQDSFS